MCRIVSEEAKQLIIKWYLEGKTVTECSKLSGRPWSTVKFIIRKYTETGTVENQYRGGRKKIDYSRQKCVSEDSKESANDQD